MTSPLIQVKTHAKNNGLLGKRQEETQDYQIAINQATLEGARSTPAGQLLLQILAAVDYAGVGVDAKGRKIRRRPILLFGRKNRQGGKAGWRYVDGFTLLVSIPTRIDTQAPVLYAGNGYKV